MPLEADDNVDAEPEAESEDSDLTKDEKSALEKLLDRLKR